MIDYGLGQPGEYQLRIYFVFKIDFQIVGHKYGGFSSQLDQVHLSLF